jgi:tRNA A-37 threonylcarbamoyl transferase component Bud32
MEDRVTSPQLLADRYELLGAIGTGGSATVWRALDRRLKRPVAIKILHPRYALDATFKRRMDREARHIASLQCANVVTIYDVDATTETPFIVMELVEGISLRELLDYVGQLPMARVLAIADDVLSALISAHESGLIHRDIKPANILLERHGPAKVTDFGISRSITQTIDITVDGLFTGTIAYSSPEQLSGSPVGTTSDLYSLGCVLYECLCGSPPVATTEASHAAFQQRFAEPLSIAVRRMDTPPTLAAAVMRALEKEPGYRFASASEMRTALQPATKGADREQAAATTVNGQGNHAQSAGELRVTRRRGRVFRKRSVAASVALLAVFTVVVGFVASRGHGSDPSTLSAGATLHRGDSLMSPNGRYRVIMQAGGSLVTEDAHTGEPIWSTGTDGNQGAYAVLQKDGNFLVHRGGKSAPTSVQLSSVLYQTRTSGHVRTKLHLLDDGNLVLIGSNAGTWLWQSGSISGVHGSRLTAGQGLHPQQYLRSKNGAFELSNDGWTGRLRLYAVTSASCSMWTAPAVGDRASVAVLLPNGDFVMYGPVSRVTWSTMTAGNPGAQLVLGNDGSLSLLSASRKTLWQAPETTPTRGNTSCSS